MGFILTEARLYQTDNSHESAFIPIKDIKDPAEAIAWADKVCDTHTASLRFQLKQYAKTIATLQRRLTSRDKGLAYIKQQVKDLVERLQPCEYCIHKGDVSDKFESQGGCHACLNHGASFFKLDRSIDEVLRDGGDR